MLCCAVLCCAVPCCAVLCRAVPCCAVPCRAVPCRAVVVPGCVVLCRAEVSVFVCVRTEDADCLKGVLHNGPFCYNVSVEQGHT